MKYIIEFTAEELQIISMGLAELPYKLSAPLIVNINEQIKVLMEKNDSKSS